ncbi:MAG: PLDc_N domain-containing protein, partial [Ottowia sp.]|nr:PLDc_N domain-containing protein [Ottowia sp.]
MAAISAFLLVLHVVLVLGFVLRVLLRNGLAATTRMAWIGVILLLPYVGCLLYFLFGDADIGRGVLGRYKRVRDLVREQIADDAQAALVMGAPGGMEALV